MNKILKLLAYKFLSPNSYAKFIGVKFGSNCKFRTKYFGTEPYLIEVGDNVQTSSNVYFINHDGGVGVLRNLYKDLKKTDLIKRIIIGNNVFIGFNVTILLGTKIGNNVIVGAGSVVKGELMSNSVYAGVPAKYICSIDSYKEKNSRFFLNTFSIEPVKKEEILRGFFLESNP
ncbi:DapH/DapD/GlmU-related protein [Methylobacter sp. BlB1]|uniref:acyltransferase n=1 Tax=Methylobacter sp. BlB1 TaxID=2785914 RepID=UPI00189430A3|nr:acyltransferase [Methylobacter sp. BlB1]MBF6648735.1 acyltransferase [Methylobacter sp. BlB1]